MPAITANISSDEKVQEARIAAVKSRKSLRQWAGEVIELHLARKTATKPAKSPAAK